MSLGSIATTVAPIVYLGFPVWMFLDCASRPVKDKRFWLLLMALGGILSFGLMAIIGSIFYALTGRNIVRSQNQAYVPWSERATGPPTVTYINQSSKFSLTIKIVAIIYSLVWIMSIIVLCWSLASGDFLNGLV